MYKTSVVVLLINGLLITCAKPQYGAPSGGATQYEGSSPSPQPPQPQPQSAPSYAAAPAPAPPAPQPQSAPQQQSYPAPAPAPQPQSAPQQQSYAAAPAPAPQPQSAPAQSSYGGSSGATPQSAPAPTGGAGAAKSGDLTVQCKANPDPSGTIKYDCSGANKDAITLKTEHILWLESQAGASQNLDIEIPNYNIDEFIKAAYKALGPQEGAKINVLLKKPDVTYNAEKDDAPKQSQQPPAVSLNYQPVDKISVHYPTQKQYGHGSGDSKSAPPPAPAAPQPAPSGPAPPAPAPAPARNNAGGGAYSRPYRQSGTSYYFYRQ